MSGAPALRTPHVELFTTGPGCTLCERAWGDLMQLASTLRFTHAKVGLTETTPVPPDYVIRVPVVHVDGEAVIEGRIEPADLRAALEAAGVRPR
ncbi:MAG: glutaredoxin family protein [Planctomycetota bacterium]|nr:glutaredoxin family protein [Planctomycetota bacterium]